MFTKGEKMKKRKNIIISAITCLFSICLMMFGVYAASNPSVSISGQVSYSARDAKVLVLGKVNGQAGNDSNVDYPAVADATNPQENEKKVSASQYMGFTKGTSANDDTDNLAPWAMNATHAFYEDSTGIRPIVISFKMTNLSNYPVVATVDFTGVTEANLASKNLTRTTTELKDSKVYLDKNVTKEISVTYSVANDAVGVNGDGLLNMSITFEKTVFPTPVQSEVQIGEAENVQTVNQADWKYSFDGDSFTVVKFVGNFPEKVDGESTLEIPSQVKCEDGTVYPIKTIGTMSDDECIKYFTSDDSRLYNALVILDAEKAQKDDTYMDKAPTNVVIPEGIEKLSAGAFMETSSLKELPSSIKEIGAGACAATSITALNLPNVEKVGQLAFTYTPITVINLPNLTWIDNNAFSNCNKLEKVIIYEEDVSKIHCGQSIFGTVSSSSKLKIYVPVEDYKTATNWSTYKDYMVVGNAVISEETVSDWKVEICSGSTANIIGYVGDITKETVTVPSSVEFEGKTYKVVSVGDMKQYASDEYQTTAKPLYNDSYESIVGLIWEGKISSLPSVKNLIIQEGIKNIGYAAFAGWLKIEQLVLPDSLQNISSNAFAWCGRAKTGSTLSVKIPDSITEIKSSAFGFTGITNLELSSNLKTIGEFGFYGAYISSLMLPNTLESIGKDAFNSCKNLTELTIPKNIKSLGDTSFAYCTALITVTFESTTPPEYMNGNAPFHECSKIADIFVPAESVKAYKAKFGESNLLTPLVKAK